jgi:DNA modification methylase
MKFDKSNWKDLDINTDSLWIIGPRAKGGKHENVYHGNYVPQIPNQMIRRYTEENNVVLDMFMGSGTTLFECESLKRNYIGFDINNEIISYVESKMDSTSVIDYYIHNCDITNTEKVSELVETDLKSMNKRTVDLIMSHPPYLDIVKFTDKPEDLSNISNINDFIAKFVSATNTVWKFLKKGKYFCLVIGDIYRDSEVIPLGFYLMYAIKRNFNCKLKGIVVKDMLGNRAKVGIESLWRYRALKSDNFLFKHEYIFVFKKQ